jgi:hypothetical protein
MMLPRLPSQQRPFYGTAFPLLTAASHRILLCLFPLLDSASCSSSLAASLLHSFTSIVFFKFFIVFLFRLSPRPAAGTSADSFRADSLVASSTPYQLLVDLSLALRLAWSNPSSLDTQPSQCASL